MLWSVFANVILTTTYGVALGVARLCHIPTRRRWCPTRRIAVVGSFDSRNWFLSHAIPLAASGVDEVIFVADAPQAELEHVRFVCPPRWGLRIFGRTLSKCAAMILVGVRYRPDVYMGFHVFPGAVTALVAARLFGRAACYQMTGGPIELLGGGVGAENRVMAGLGRPSKRLERLALAVTREFDLVVVRGRGASRFLTRRGVRRVEIITGSVDVPKVDENRSRPIDMVFVGRLSKIKQPEQFLKAVDRVKRGHPRVRAVVVGTGPEQPLLERLVLSDGLSQTVRLMGHLENVFEVLKRSKVFVLTSISEGFPISVLEAMACGVPTVAADVGELRDLVISGETGWLVTPNAIGEYAERIESLLEDEGLWNRMSMRGREVAQKLASRRRVAQRWNQVIGAMTAPLQDVGSASGAGNMISAPEAG